MIHNMIIILFINLYYLYSIKFIKIIIECLPRICIPRSNI